jgi:hypothetical protein
LDNKVTYHTSPYDKDLVVFVGPIIEHCLKGYGKGFYHGAFSVRHLGKQSENLIFMGYKIRCKASAYIAA